MSGVLNMLLASNAAAAAATTTWNPSDKAHTNLSLGNLKATSANDGSPGGVRSILSHSTGKWYFEFTLNADVTFTAIGVADSTFTLGNTLGNDAVSAGYFAQNGVAKANSAANTFTGSTWTTGDIIGVAVDVPNHKIYWSKNGTWQNSAVPSSGTGFIDYVFTGAAFAVVNFGSSGASAGTANFGGTAFNTAAPSGFSAWG